MLHVLQKSALRRNCIDIMLESDMNHLHIFAFSNGTFTTTVR